MRLALIRARYDPFGGAEKFVETAATALADQGVTLTILTRAWPREARAGMAHRLLDPRYFTSTGRDRGFARAVCGLLAREHFDLVQSHERIACCDVYRAGDGVHAEWLAQRRRVTGTARRLGIAWNPHHRYLLDAERQLFTSARLKAVICNSRMVRDEIVRHFGTAAEKLHVIYSGVDSVRYSPALRSEFRAATRQSLDISPGAPVALYVGSGFERKGLAAFIEAVAQIAGLRAIVVGKDKHAARYRRQAEACAPGRIAFTGGVRDVRPYYAAADMFALPTLYDPFPNACLEAMACGLPVLTSTKSGAAEIIEAGRSGFVTDALDVPAMVDAMARMAADPTMGEAARERILPHTPAAMARQYVALYRHLLDLPTAA